MATWTHAANSSMDGEEGKRSDRYVNGRSTGFVIRKRPGGFVFAYTFDNPESIWRRPKFVGTGKDFAQARSVLEKASGAKGRLGGKAGGGGGGGGGG